jgi:periplasmic protein TonB
VPITGRSSDGPWRRLIWSLPAAIAISGLMLSGFLAILAQAPSLPAPHNVVAMRIMELPPEQVPADALPMITTSSPPAVKPPRQTEPEEVPTPSPEALPVIETPPAPPQPIPPKTTPKMEPPKPIEPVPAEALPMIETAQAPPSPPKVLPPSEVSPSPPPPKPEPPHPRRTARRQTAHQTQSHPQVSQRTPAPNPAAPGSSASRNPTGGVTMGARALYKPMPEIPEELRHRELTFVAVASFNVAANGAATVTLLRATADPRMNAALMSALRNWRFFPAMENGHPVASIIEIRIPIEVK